MNNLQNNTKYSVQNGLLWLSSSQNKDGSFGTLTPITTTALAIQSFSNCSKPVCAPLLCHKYDYTIEINSALKYILDNSKIDSNGVYFEENGNINMPTGAVLQAFITLNLTYKEITVPTSSIEGYTFETLINSIINYLTISQNSHSAWGSSNNYDISSNNTTSSFVIGGLLATKYNGYSISPSIYSNLENWVDYIQNNYGGAGEFNSYEGVNIANTAALIQKMYFIGYSSSDKNLKASIQYIANNWYTPVSYFNPGWHCGANIDYKAAYEVMNSFSLYKINFLQNSFRKRINWFADIVTTLLQKQNPNGSWPVSEINYEQSDPAITTIYSILTLEITLSKIYFF